MSPGDENHLPDVQSPPLTVFVAPKTGFSCSFASKGQRLATVSREKLDGENTRFRVHRVEWSHHRQCLGEQTYFEHFTELGC